MLFFLFKLTLFELLYLSLGELQVVAMSNPCAKKGHFI